MGAVQYIPATSLTREMDYVQVSQVSRKRMARAHVYVVNELKEGHVLFNDALNTFYLRLYGVRPFDSEKGNPLPPHTLLLSINSKGSFICTTHRQDNTYHGLCYTSRGALACVWLMNLNKCIIMQSIF